MSVERQHGELHLVCDDCGEPYDMTYGADDFAKMTADAKADGWKTFKRDGDWCNACPECSAEWVEGQKQGRLL